MKILHVISDSNIGGAGVLLCNLLRHLDRRRFESAVALPYGSALRSRVLGLELPVYELEHSCDRISFASVRELARLIRAEKPDVVHANAALSARVAGRLYGKRVVYTRHCCYEVHPSGGWLLWEAKKLGNRLLCDRAVATADAAAENLKDMGISKQQICVIRNGCEAVRGVSEEELRQWRERLSLAEEDYCVGICARLEPYKGQDLFLQAAASLCRFMPERRFRFLIVGEGSQRDALERLAHALGIDEAVRFVGFAEDPAPLYRLLRIHVNCSRGTETSCLAVSEGMSAGLPTVLSAYGGNRAMIGNSRAGICFSTGSVEELTAAIARIASDPELEQEMSRAARRRYEQLFTAEEMARRLEDCYLQLQP